MEKICKTDNHCDKKYLNLGKNYHTNFGNK